MPRVPMPDGRPVLTELPRTPTPTGVDARALSASGEQMVQVGAGIQQAGAALHSQAMEEFERTNTAMAEAAFNTLQERTFALQTEFTQLRGANALQPGEDGTPPARRYADRYDELQSQVVEGLGSDRARELFGVRAADLGVRYRASIMSHMVEQNREFQLATHASTVAAAADALSLSPGDSATVARETLRAREALAASADLEGLVGEAREQHIRAGVGTLHREIAEGLAQAGHGIAAWEYIRDRRADFNPSAYAEAESEARTAANGERAISLAEQVLGRYPPSRNGTDMLSVHSAIQAEAGGDEELARLAFVEASRLATLTEASIRLRESNAYERALAMLAEGQTGELFTSPLYRQLSPEAQQRLLIAATDPPRATREENEAYAHHLGQGFLDHMRARRPVSQEDQRYRDQVRVAVGPVNWARIQDMLAPAPASGTQRPGIRAAQWSALLREFGVDGADATRVGALRNIAETAIISEQDRLGRALSDAETLERARGALATEVTARGGWFNTSVDPEPRALARVPLSDVFVPEGSARDAIVERLREQGGGEPSDALIAEQYVLERVLRGQ